MVREGLLNIVKMTSCKPRLHSVHSSKGSVGFSETVSWKVNRHIVAHCSHIRSREASADGWYMGPYGAVCLKNDFTFTLRENLVVLAVLYCCEYHTTLACDLWCSDAESQHWRRAGKEADRTVDG